MLYKNKKRTGIRIQTTITEKEMARRKMEFAGRGSYGKTPKVFLDDGIITKMEFDIHDFENLPQKRGEYVYTTTIKAHGHLWKLWIYPGGNAGSYIHAEYVSIGLTYAGENTKTDPVVAKAGIRTKTINRQLKKRNYSKGRHSEFGLQNFATREDIIEDDCDEAGTLTVTVELQVATEKRSVWFPQSTYSSDDIVTQLYNSTKTSDIITFIIGIPRMELVGHKCILFLRARTLYELVITEEESLSSSSSKNNVIVLADVDEIVFEIFWKFIHTGKVPTLNDENEELAKSILLVANRFGVTELKLYMESILVETFLVPSNATGLLLFADSYTCPLLKEASMDTCITDPTIFMDITNDNWKKVQESSKLLSELLAYTNNDRKRYSPAVDDLDDATIDDVDEFDVTSLRERLQQVTLDVDGSREILVQRWKDYVRVRAANNNKSNETDITVT